MAKDWTGTVIACIALAVSAGSAYYNVFVQKDDLRVVIGHAPLFERAENGELNISGDQELTFINSGNRAAAITSLGGIAWVTSNRERPHECERAKDEIPVYITFDSKPFVLKSGEILVVKAGLAAGDFVWRKRRDGTFSLPKDIHAPKIGDTYLVCITLNIVTPDNYATQSRKPVFKYVLEERFSLKKEELFEKEKPIAILQRTGFVFWRSGP